MSKIFITTKDNLTLLVGAGSFIYGLFSFTSDYYSGYTEEGISLPSLGSTFHDYPIAVYYYYNQISLILLVLGSLLILTWFLRRKTQ